MLCKETRVLIAVNETSPHVYPHERERYKYVGHTGKIAEVCPEEDRVLYYVVFDDEKLQKRNEKEGEWLWTDKELVSLHEDNKDFVR